KIEEGKRRPSKQLAALLAAQLSVAAEEQAAFIRAARQGSAPAPAATKTYSRPLFLPAPLTPLIGRERELAAVVRRFRAGETRLLTLLGPPGVGKTRLSLAAAWHMTGQYAQGAAFTGLAPISGDGEVVAAAVLDSLELRAPEKQRAGVLRDHLAGREMLLVLDNFEHILEAADLVDYLLRSAPRLHILATSREPLRLYGEARYTLAPLPTETSRDNGQVTSPAAELFTARVRDVSPEFTLTAANRPLVDAICARLDGLPLALELAAVQAQRQGLPDLLAGLEQCLEILQQQRGNVPARHLSLRSAVTWSTNLLNDDQRQSFYILGLFRGGFTPQAVSKVTARADLPDLVAASLVQSAVSENGQPRYTLLETMREMALAGLEETTAAQRARRRFARCFHDLAQEAYAGFSTAGMPQWQARMTLEKENLRAALAWCEDNDAQLGLQLARHMWMYWYLWGEYRQGLRWLDCFLDQNPAPTALRGEALNGAGTLLTRFGEFERARGYFAQGLQIGRDQADVEVLTRSLIGLAETDYARGSFDAGRPRFEEALAIFETIDDNRGISWALGGLATYEHEAKNDTKTAAEIMAEAVNFARQHPDIRHLGWFLCILADFQRDLGQFDEARDNLAEGLALLIETADRPGQAFSKLRLAGLALDEGHFARARPLLKDSMRLAYDTYTLSYAAQGIILAGLLLLQQGELDTGLRLCAAAEAIYPPVRKRLLHADVGAIDSALTSAREQITEEAFAHLWNVGLTYNLPTAVDLALAAL
ncbi:MAG: tetratricopeptide repeat protein, partial [Candidatus Promineifilaceae bacterium]|nr:tetratricopeptide repeat protein [Candidatus Promineifilaceae bacterium]